MVTLLVEAQNPFAEYGYEVKIATLSQGRFNEFFDQDSIVQIGSVWFNVNTKQIVSFAERDTINPENDPEPYLASRWMSSDPLADDPSQLDKSPYQYAFNNPILFIDPDGLLPWIAGTDGKKVTYSTDEKGNTTWSANASKDTKRLGNAMLKTKTGTKSLDNLISADTQVNLNIKNRDESAPNRRGVTLYDGISKGKDGKHTAKVANITIFEDVIKEQLSNGKTPLMKILAAAEMLIDDQGMASTASHESVHATDPSNIHLSIASGYDKSNTKLAKDREVTPQKVQKKVAAEAYQNVANTLLKLIRRLNESDKHKK